MSYQNRLRNLKKLLSPEVNLLAVSKGHSEVSIRALASSGQIDFGESRVQEALPKINLLSDLTELKWHFVGRLQANKIRSVVRSFDVIHSVDSLKIAERISRIAGEERKQIKVMIQLKLHPDPTKGGISLQELLDIWVDLKQLSNMQIIGLMTIPPLVFDLEHRKSLFQECREIANQLELKHCSMGMSRDWEEAVEAGSTWIRIGSFLFGDRAK